MNIPPDENKKLMAQSWSAAVKKTNEAMEFRKVTHDLVAMRLKQALNAKETLCRFDGGRFGSGEWVYSKPLIAHDIRLKAVALAAKLLDMEPPEKKEIMFDEETFNAILSGLPAGIGEAVRAELVKAISNKRD